MGINWTDVWVLLRLALDILAVWALLYALVRIIRNNARTIQIVKGIMAVFLVKLLSDVMQLQALSTVLNLFLNWGVFFVLIILQPELRSMMEKVGKTTSILRTDIPAQRMEKMIDQVVNACEDMSRTKTGAIISIQMGQSLEDYARNGIAMDSDVTTELLETIFQYGTPMHDGAVIIEGDKLAAAAAYLPSTSRDLPSKYGARHRAAVGISEVTDSITLVVSEETGNISVASKGQLTQYNPAALRRYLTNQLVPASTVTSSMLDPVIKTARNFSSSLSRNRQNAPETKEQKKTDERIKPIEVVDLRDQGGTGHE